MKIHPLKQFVSLRDQLTKRKAELEKELSEINSALGSEVFHSPVASSHVASAAHASSASKGGASRGRRAKNTMSLKEAVLAVTKSKPLTKQEILDAVDKLGYKFTAKNPTNSLNTLLYSDKAFKNHDGKFGSN
jgi:hypothetical protein